MESFPILFPHFAKWLLFKCIFLRPLQPNVAILRNYSQLRINGPVKCTRNALPRPTDVSSTVLSQLIKPAADELLLPQIWSFKTLLARDKIMAFNENIDLYSDHSKQACCASGGERIKRGVSGSIS